MIDTVEQIIHHAHILPLDKKGNYEKFFQRFFGALTAIILAAIIFPQYSDYQSVIETENWLNDVIAIQKIIEIDAAKKKSFTGIRSAIKISDFPQKNISFFKVLENGEIILKGGRDGQIIILIPSFQEEKIIWTCVGGSNDALPRKCKSN